MPTLYIIYNHCQVSSHIYRTMVQLVIQYYYYFLVTVIFGFPDGSMRTLTLVA